MDVFHFARFPFTSGAAKYVEALGIRLDELFSERAFEQVRLKGKERVLSALGDGIAKSTYPDRVSAEKELLSYPVARILVSCLNDSYLIQRYALAEAKSASEKLRELDDDDIKEFANDFGIKALLNTSVIIHFTDYIRYAHAIHEPKWKLVNRNINKGNVTLTKEDFSSILEEAVRKRIDSSLPILVPEHICTLLKHYLEEIRSKLVSKKSEFSIEFREILPDCFPPCIIRALVDAKAGLNLSHSMRFALVSFLLNIGMNTEDIIKLFRVLPDFDEERTRYQVMHIYRMSYTSPSCATMVTYGNCSGKDEICERISHPLSYYRRKAWIKGKRRVGKAGDLNLSHQDS